MTISPKVLIPTAIAVVAALGIFLLTQDKSYLVALLVSLVAAGGGIAAKPAPEVTQAEVDDLSLRKRGLR